MDYSYRQRFFEQVDRRRDRFKHHVGGLPTAFRIHIPLARLCDHYNLSMEAPSGYYFYEQRILEETRPIERSQVERGWKRRILLSRRAVSKLDNIPSNSEVMLSREVGGATIARMFLGNGRRREKRLHAGFRVFEIPPGTGGMAALVLCSCLFLSLLLLWWTGNYIPGSTPSDVPSLLVGLATLGPVTLQSGLHRANIVSVPLMSRVYLLAASLSMVALSVWLLSQSSLRRVGHDGYVRWWHDHGGPFLTAILLGALLHSARRVLVNIRNYRHVRSQDH